MACALRVLHRLKPDSLVFIHDFFSRTQLYGGVMDYYDEVARVLAVRNDRPEMGPIDEPQGLVVLRPKPEALATRLTDDQINAKYDSINWREPFAPPINTIHGFLNYYVLLSFDFSKWRRIRSPEHLVRTVRGDILHLILVYAVVSLAVARLRDIVARPRSSRKWKSPALPTPVVASGGATKSANAVNRRSVGGQGASPRPTPATQPASVVGAPPSDLTENGEPRFFETEAIRLANARRKSRQTSP